MRNDHRDFNRGFIGKPEHRLQDLAATYAALAMEDEAAGRTLMNTQSYRQAIYFFIQAMEKYVRYGIFSVVDPHQEQFRERARTHNLDELLEFLVEVSSDDARLRKQVQKQLDDLVLEGVRFGMLHNNIRYPWYSKHFNSYSLLHVVVEDAQEMEAKLDKLKAFVADFHRLT